MAQPLLRCGNCDRTIGGIETPCEHDGRAVCADRHTHLCELSLPPAHHRIDHPKIPMALYVVAFLQLASGLLCLSKMVTDWFISHKLTFETGIISVLVCFGLLRLSNAWRIVALVLLVVGFVFASIIFVLGVTARMPMSFDILGMHRGHVPGWVVSLLVVSFVPLGIWQFYILLRPDVRNLFQNGGRK